MSDLANRIASLLEESEQPLSTPEIASALGVTEELVDQTIWDETDLFQWQPRHRWTTGTAKMAPRAKSAAEMQDARDGPLAPRSPIALRAITLAGGTQLKVLKRPMDSEALFTVRPAGSNIELILNSAHDVFDLLPIPFESDSSPDGFQVLVELMLESWAVFEDGVSGTSTKKGVEDARMLWGRNLGELARSTHGRS